jgi:hypothetical protein
MWHWFYLPQTSQKLQIKMYLTTFIYHVQAQHLPIRNPETDQDEMIMSVRLLDVPKMVAIGWLEAAPQIGEI